MEKQMRAERELREKILIAEGQKQSAILATEAEKEAQIRKAEGEAQAILDVQKATADGLHMIKEVGINATVLKLRNLETMEKAVDGKATKITVPSDIQNMAGLVTSITEIDIRKKVVKDKKDADFFRSASFIKKWKIRSSRQFHLQL